MAVTGHRAQPEGVVPVGEAQAGDAGVDQDGLTDVLGRGRPVRRAQRGVGGLGDRRAGETPRAAAEQADDEDDRRRQRDDAGRPGEPEPQGGTATRGATRGALGFDARAERVGSADVGHRRSVGSPDRV